MASEWQMIDSDPAASAAPGRRGDASADAPARPGGASLLGGFPTESFSSGSSRDVSVGGSGAGLAGGSGASGNGTYIGSWRHGTAASGMPAGSAAELPRDRHSVDGAQVEVLSRLRTAPPPSAPGRTAAPGSGRRVIKMKGGRAFTREQFLAAGKDEWDTSASAQAPRSQSYSRSRSPSSSVAGGRASSSSLSSSSSPPQPPPSTTSALPPAKRQASPLPPTSEETRLNGGERESYSPGGSPGGYDGKGRAGSGGKKMTSLHGAFNDPPPGYEDMGLPYGCFKRRKYVHAAPTRRTARRPAWRLARRLAQRACRSRSQ